MSDKAVLWVTRESCNSCSGDAIFDSKLRRALETRLAIDVLTLSRSKRDPLRLCRLVAHGIPHDRASFATAENVRALHRAQGTGRYRAIILSHECFDWMLPYISLPTVLVLHNVTSAYVRATFPSEPLGALLERWYSRYERRAYVSRPNFIAVCLSESDRNYLKRLNGVAHILVAPPGAPAQIELRSGARVTSTLVVSGSFEWQPKRRDLLRFAQEYSRERPGLKPVVADNLPPDIVALLYDACREAPDPAHEITFGLVADRFKAGFKLKVGAHVAANMITLTFSDVLDDYLDVPFAKQFIRRIGSVAEAAMIVRGADNFGPQDVARFLSFKRAVLQKFTWAATAATIENAVDALFGNGNA